MPWFIPDRGPEPQPAPAKDTKPAPAPPPKSPDANHASGHLLSPELRTALKAKFTARALAVESNFQDAASQVRVEELLKKDDGEVHWLAALFFEAAVSFIGGQIVKSLVRVKASRGAELKALLTDAALHQEDLKLNLEQRLTSISQRLSDESIKSTIDQAFKPAGKRGVKNAGDARSQEHKGAKAQTLSFIDYVQDTASVTYQTFRENAESGLSDADLMLLIASLDANNHLIRQYKYVIEQKVKRFRDSKVSEIGRKFTTRTSYTDDGKPINTGGWAGQRVMRDIYVEWHTYLSSSPNELVYRFHDSYDSPDTINDDEPGRAQLPMKPTDRKKVTAEPERGGSEDPRSLYIVPREFHALAIQRHIQMWGHEPHFHFIDDSNFADPIRAKSARENRARQDRSAPAKAPAPGSFADDPMAGFGSTKNVLPKDPLGLQDKG
ncbi:MAG TPA: hypothetical protein VIU61_29045 [Kofleriaceae bacterium]